VKVKAGSGAWTYRMKDTIVRPNEEKISPKWVRRGVIELSTISNGSTTPFENSLFSSEVYFLRNFRACLLGYNVRKQVGSQGSKTIHFIAAYVTLGHIRL